jgi:hypothetical protein
MKKSAKPAPGMASSPLPAMREYAAALCLVLASAALHAAPEAVYNTVLRRTDRDKLPAGETLDEPFTADAVHIRLSNQSITGNIIADTILDTDHGRRQKLAAAAHRDAIQLIPENAFAAGVLENLVISRNVIRSAGALQGIFGSDGVFRNVAITGNTIDTASAHKVLLNGLVGKNSRIEGNRNAAGELVMVELNPIRLGGNAGTGNVWVLSVVAEDEAEYGYGEIDVGADGTREHIRDSRRSFRRQGGGASGDTYLRDFPMTRFKHELAVLTIQALLDRQPELAREADAWLLRLANLPENRNDPARVKRAQQVLARQRHVPIAEFDAHSREVQSFFIQAVAKSLGTPVAIGADGGDLP